LIGLALDFGMMIKRRIIRLIVLAAALVAASGERSFAQSQTPAAQETPPATKTVPIRRSLRANKANRTTRLDMLYEALAKAPNQAIAKIVEAKIEALNLQSGSITADLLMLRARSMIEAKDSKLAFELLDSIIAIAPNFTEAWAQRATLRYVTKDISGALADLRVVLAHEPRHYGALTGLGVILQEIGEDKRALEALRRALAVDPYLDAVPDMVKKLEVEVEGRDI
jgi:tetratricopeptide (TPR) repeat protein